MAFIATIHLIDTAAKVRRALFAITSIGAAVVFLDLVQVITSSPSIYGTVPALRPVANSGPFYHYNHFSQFVNISIGAALGVLFIDAGEWIFGLPGRIGNTWWPLSRREQLDRGFLLSFLTVAVISIMLAASRGGIVSLAGASILTALVVLRKRKSGSRVLVVWVILLGGFGLTLIAGFDVAMKRLETLQSFETAFGVRWQILKDVFTAYPHFPLLGSGLGTFEYVYPMFDRSTDTLLATHAENEYAQALFETGVLGLACVLMFMGTMVGYFVRVTRSFDSAVEFAAFGVFFGLVATMLQSASDFGQHLPAVACLSAVMCGLLVSLSRIGKPKGLSVPGPITNSGHNITSGSRFVLRPLAASLTFAICGLGLFDTTRAWAAERQWKHGEVLRIGSSSNGRTPTPEDDQQMVVAYARAAEIEPENVKYQWSLAQYKWVTISRTIDPQTGTIQLRAGDYGRLPEIVAHLSRAMYICPTFGPAYALAGELKVFVLGDAAGRHLIYTAYRLSPCNPVAVFAAGRLDAAENRWDDCRSKFERYATMSGFGPVLHTLLNEAGRPDIAFEIAKGNRDRTEQLTAALNDGWDQFAELAAEAKSEADRLLTLEADAADAESYVIAIAARRSENRQDFVGAAKYYHRALQKDYGQVNWRFSLAECLARAGNIRGAAEQARLCLRLRPQMTEARKLLEDLSVRRIAPVDPAAVGG